MKVPSEKAKRLHGYGWVWKHRAKFRTRPPDSEDALFQWFYPYVKYDLPCRIRVVRNHAKGESRGWKSVVYGQMNHRHLEIIRRAHAWRDARSLSWHKPVPRIGEKPLPLSRQPEWSRSESEGHVIKPYRHRFRFGQFSKRLKEQGH